MDETVGFAWKHSQIRCHGTTSARLLPDTGSHNARGAAYPCRPRPGGGKGETLDIRAGRDLAAAVKEMLVAG